MQAKCGISFTLGLCSLLPHVHTNLKVLHRGSVATCPYQLEGIPSRVSSVLLYDAENYRSSLGESFHRQNLPEFLLFVTLATSLRHVTQRPKPAPPPASPAPSQPAPPCLCLKMLYDRTLSEPIAPKNFCRLKAYTVFTFRPKKSIFPE